MKSIFKGVIIIKYTDNKEKNEFNSMRDELLEKNMIKQDFDLEGYIQQLDQMIQEFLIQSVQSENEKLIKQIAAQHGFNDEQDYKDIKSVWESESENIYAHIIRKNTHNRRLDALDYSVNNMFYSRKLKDINKSSTVVSMKTSTYNGNEPQFLTFELNKQELQDFSDSIKNVEQQINNILYPNQEEEQPQQE